MEKAKNQFLTILSFRKFIRKNNYDIVISFFIFYFISVTNSRFGENDSGASGGMISYAGQSFINFCFFFDNHPYNGFSLQKVLPLFNKLFVNDGINSSVELNSLMSMLSGVEHGIFNTFIGDISMASINFIGIIYVILYFFISNYIVKYLNKDFYGLLLIFLLITIPMLGLFVHFYADFGRMIVFITFVIYSLSAPRVKFNR